MRNMKRTWLSVLCLLSFVLGKHSGCRVEYMGEPLHRLAELHQHHQT